MKKNKDVLSLSTRKTEEIIRRVFNTGELNDMKEEICNDIIKQDLLEDEFARVKSEHKAKVDAIKFHRKDLLTNVKQGYADEKMEVHNVPNDAELTIEFYDLEGTLVGSRRMTATEKPTIIYPIEKGQTQ